MQDQVMTPEQQTAYDTALARIEACRRDQKIVLDLASLGLVRLPPEIGQLTALRRLDLIDNQLSSLPPEICQLTALTELDISLNQLSSLPPEICQLRALTRLYLFGNQLSSLPPEIGQLTALTDLAISNNQLSSLPPEICQLRALIALDMSLNQLSSLPPEIGQLTALTLLDLTGNQLSSLPIELNNLPNLAQLFLHDNPALQLSPTVLGPDPRDGKKDHEGGASAKSILDFYFSRQQDKTRPLNEVKLILVGRGGAGKTSTVRALQGLPFNASEESTPGIALCDWVMDGCKKGPVTAHVWDFAGQVITHALHQFFFSMRSVYVVVLAGRENNERDDAACHLSVFKAINGMNSPVKSIAIAR